MPAKNVVKQYVPEAYYHIYNRGVDSGLLFRDDKDYKIFLSYMKLYLSLQGDSLKVAPSRLPKNYFGEIKLLCYCLMPNHFHLFVRQTSDHGMDHFMRSLLTKYVRYFNTRYRRSGPLFTSTYKAVHIQTEYQFIYLSKYIHRNPVPLFSYKDIPCRLREYPYSSYGNYLGLFTQSWISTEAILSYFSRINPQFSYEEFVEYEHPDDLKPILDEAIDLV